MYKCYDYSRTSESRQILRESRGSSQNLSLQPSAAVRMLELYFFTDRATTKDVVLLPALCHDMALVSIALQLVLLVLILSYLLLKALFDRVVIISRARRAALEEAAQEQEPKFRIELQPPSKCLRFGIKWDPDLRYMIKTLKAEGEEGLTRFLDNEVFVWKLRSYVRNKFSKAFKMNIKRDTIRLRQQRQLRERTAQKTPEQERQDRHALRELFGQAEQPTAAAQEQAPLIQKVLEKPAASLGPPVEEAGFLWKDLFQVTIMRKPY